VPAAAEMIARLSDEYHAAKAALDAKYALTSREMALAAE
jgi:hypothetical protein